MSNKENFDDIILSFGGESYTVKANKVFGLVSGILSKIPLVKFQDFSTVPPEDVIAAYMFALDYANAGVGHRAISSYCLTKGYADVIESLGAIVGQLIIEPDEVEDEAPKKTPKKKAKAKSKVKT